MIKPTVGRVVWFRQGSDGFERLAADDGQPLAAIITKVWGDRMVNLCVLDANGNPHSRTSVVLVQEGDLPPSNRAFVPSYCEWMPCQKGQAARTEQAEAVARAAAAGYSGL